MNQVIPANFTVHFSSDLGGTFEGFILNWSCTQWGEWNPLYDGSCRSEKRPANNGETTIGELQYKSNTICRKFT